MEIKEDKSCYASEIQRELLIAMNANELIRENFFLTGGTALAVFYLHHRKSDDLDFFSVEHIETSVIDFWIQREFHDVIKVNDFDTIKSYLISGVKVEFVNDHLSINDEKEVIKLDSSVKLKIDTIRNISSNKLCTLISRSEFKDYLDFYFLLERYPGSGFDMVYEDALMKDRIFEDAPTAAYKIEEGFEYARRNYSLMPKLIANFDRNRFELFYQNLIKNIYNRLS